MTISRNKIVVCVLAMIATALILSGTPYNKNEGQMASDGNVETRYSAKKEFALWIVREGKKNLRAGRVDNAKDYAIIGALFGNEKEAGLLGTACDKKKKVFQDFMTAEMNEAMSTGDVERETRMRNFVKHIEVIEVR